MKEVPFDIWERVSHFLPRAFLTTLSEVNRPLNDIATRARYEVIMFLKFDRYTKRFCRSLGDPRTRRGDVVRRVEITPWLVKPRVKSCRNQSVNVWRWVTSLFDPDCTTREMNQLITKRVNKDITRITDAVFGLRNATEYKLGWDQHRDYHPEFFRAFLSPVLTRMQDRLVVLSLKVPPDMLRSLASIALPQLQQLEVNVCTLGMPSREVDQVFDSFTVFVNNLYPTLKSLSISSFLPSKFLDFTRFFNNLGFFPRLDTFRFSIPFDGAHLSSSTVLSTFLAKHQQTLRHLQLTTSRCAAPDATPDPKSKYWIPNILASLDTPRPQLHELHLALRPLRADLSPITDFLHKHAPKLKSLTLTDRCLTYQEVQTILDSIIDTISETCSLRQLHFRVSHLSPALLDLLASRLPRLAHLELSFSEVRATATHLTANYARPRGEELKSFKAEVLAKKANYAQWELVTISIPQGPPTCLWLTDLEHLFVECIPGLQFKELPPPPC